MLQNDLAIFSGAKYNASISIIQPQNHCQSNNRLNSAQSESLFFVNIYILKKKEENLLRGVFNPDSPLMRALGVVWDLIVLNLLFLVCCIPVVTIGPAITALHYVTTKMAGEKDGTPVVGNFFKSFRANFRQGVLMGILFGAAGGFLGYDIYLLWHSGNFQNSIFKILIPVAAIAYMMTFVYAFPLLARFNNTVLGTIRNAFIMSVTSLPKTFSMLLLIGACVALTLYTQTTLRYGLFLWFALGFSSIAYANAFVLNDVFMKCSEQYSSQINQEQSQDTTENSDGKE